MVVQYYPGVWSPGVPLLTGPVQVDTGTKGEEPRSNPHSIQAQSNVNDHVTFTLYACLNIVLLNSAHQHWTLLPS